MSYLEFSSLSQGPHETSSAAALSFSISSGHKNMLKTSFSMQLELPQVGYWLKTEDILGQHKTTEDNDKDKQKTSKDDLG